ncbi:hypothetical protein M434DRAFT_377888 [Hypoxylon sp. CO27-5]|nr:hypothetical protein M434DRAFT_377888 [Hypoxylon sp. CO27-5]
MESTEQAGLLNKSQAGLPFACASQNARSEACRIEDVGTTKFTREVDSAGRFESFIILPGCTREDTDALTPPFAGSDSQSWIKEIYSHYQRIQILKNADTNIETLSQGTPLVSHAVDLKGVELVEANTQLHAQSRVQEEELKAEAKDGQNEKAVVRTEEQDEGPRSMEIDAELQAEIRLFKICHKKNSVGDRESVEVGIHNDAGKDAEKDNEECVAAYISGAFNILEASEVGKDIRGYTNISLDNPKVPTSNVSINYEGGDSDKQDIWPSSYMFNPTMDALHETDEMTNDFIDFLISTQETKPKEKRSLWKRFRLF